MDEQKDPVDILDEILNRSEQPRPSPADRPLKFDPPPEDGPPPPSTGEKPPLAQRLLPWLGVLLGGVVLALALCGVQLFSVNARLDGLQTAVGEIEVADTLLNEKQLLQRDINTLRNQIESLENERDSVYEQWWSYMQDSRLEIRFRQSEYLYYMERFTASGDLTMAALVMTLEDDVLRNSRTQNGEELPTMNAIQQERYDSIRQLLEEKGLLYSSGMTKQNGTTPLWPAGSGPSENPETATLGILWCALDQYYVLGNQNAATQFLVETPLSNPNTGWPELLREGVSESTYHLYEGLLSELISAGCLQRATNDAMGWNPGYGHPDIYYPLPFSLPGNQNNG